MKLPSQNFQPLFRQQLQTSPLTPSPLYSPNNSNGQLPVQCTMNVTPMGGAFLPVQPVLLVGPQPHEMKQNEAFQPFQQPQRSERTNQFPHKLGKKNDKRRFSEYMIKKQDSEGKMESDLNKLLANEKAESMPTMTSFSNDSGNQLLDDAIRSPVGNERCSDEEVLMAMKHFKHNSDILYDDE